MELLSMIDSQTALPTTVVAARLVLATLLGGVVGFEREWRRRPAGLRTHILVCLSAAIIAVITVELTHYAGFGEGKIQVDPARLIEAVTQGVAFLAAGVIIFSRGEVHGLTTGAGMWLASSIGLACGLGLLQLAILATLLGLTVLGLLYVFESKLTSKLSGNEDGPAEP